MNLKTVPRKKTVERRLEGHSTRIILKTKKFPHFLGFGNRNTNGKNTNTFFKKNFRFKTMLVNEC